MGTIDLRDRYESSVELRRIARGLAVTLPVVGVAGVVGPYLLGFTSLAILAVYVAVPSVIAPVLYLYASDAETVVDTDAFTENRRRHLDKLLLSVYLLLQAVSVLLLVNSEVRPYSYYVVIVGLAVVVLVQILRISPEVRRTKSILAQIALLHLNLVWGVTLKYNYFFGRTDTFSHVRGVRLISESGTLPTGFLGNYQSFPLWHIFGAMDHLLFGGQVSPRTTLFVLSGVLYASVPIVVFLVANRLFSSRKVALTAALLTGLNATVVHSGKYAIPRSTAAFLFVLILLAWVRNDDRSIALFGFFAVAIAAYHTVSLPFVFMILSIDYVFRRVVPLLSDGAAVRSVERSHLLLGLIVLVQAAYWLFFAEYLLEHLVTVVVGQGTQGQVNTGVISEPLRELANYLHHSTLLIFLFVGILNGLSSDRLPGVTKATLLSTLVLIGFSFPGPHLLVGKIAESFNVLRFAVYAFPFFAMTAAYGLISLVQSVNSPRITTEKARAVAFAAILVFSLFSFTTVSNDFVAADNPAVERQFYTSYLSEAEEQSMRTIATVGAANVSADYVGTRYYEASRFSNQSRIMGVTEDRDRLYFGARDDLLLVREKELQRRPLQVWATDDYQYGGSYHGGLEYVETDAPVWSDLTAANRVYDSGVVSAYQQTAVRSTNSTLVTEPDPIADEGN